MRTLSALLKTLRNKNSPVCQQLELPLIDQRPLSRRDQVTVARLREVRDRVAAM